MGKIPKFYGIAFLGVVLTGLLLAGLVSAAESSGSGSGEAKAVNGYRYQERVQAGVMNQWKFQEKTQFQLQTNNSMDVDMESDAENIGEKTFGLELQTQANLQLKVKMNASDPAIGLEEGKAVQVKNQSQKQYRFQHRFMVQLELNNSGDAIQARLQVTAPTEESTWVYYNEATQEFEEIPSTVENGMLVADTTHFSTYTIFTVENPSTVDGYSLFVLIPIAALAGLFIYRRRN